MVNQTRLRSLSAVPTPSLALEVHRAGIPGDPGASTMFSPNKGARPWRVAAEPSTGQTIEVDPTDRVSTLQRVDRLRDAVERLARFIHERRRDEARHPLGAVFARGELRRLRHHAIELAQAPRMRVGIALDEPPAAQDIDREIIVLRQGFGGLSEPRLQMFGLPFVPQARAPRGSQSRDAIELQEAADPPDGHAVPAVDDAVERPEQSGLAFDERAKRGGHHAADLLSPRMEVLGRIDELVGRRARLLA